MRKLATCFALVFGFGASAAQAGPLILTFLGSGTGTINLPDDSLIRNGSLVLQDCGVSSPCTRPVGAPPWDPLPPGVFATAFALLPTILYPADRPDWPPTVGAYGSLGGPGWRLELSYANGIATGGFFGSNPNFDTFLRFALPFSEFSDGFKAGRGNVGNTWSVAEVPVPASLALLGLGLAGIGAARRKSS